MKKPILAVAFLAVGAALVGCGPANQSPAAYSQAAQVPSAEPGSGMPALPPGCLEGRLKGYQVTRPDHDAGVPGVTC